MVMGLSAKRWVHDRKPETAHPKAPMGFNEQQLQEHACTEAYDTVRDF